MIRNLVALISLMAFIYPASAEDMNCPLQSEVAAPANPRASVLVHCRAGTVPRPKVLAQPSGSLPEIRQQQEQAEIAASPPVETLIYQCPRIVSGYSCQEP
jgi:hypothetical protein